MKLFLQMLRLPRLRARRLPFAPAKFIPPCFILALGHGSADSAGAKVFCFFSSKKKTLLAFGPENYR
jgi:hypothetical protein